MKKSEVELKGGYKTAEMSLGTLQKSQVLLMFQLLYVKEENTNWMDDISAADHLGNPQLYILTLSFL